MSKLKKKLNKKSKPSLAVWQRYRSLAIPGGLFAVGLVIVVSIALYHSDHTKRTLSVATTATQKSEPKASSSVPQSQPTIAQTAPTTTSTPATSTPSKTVTVTPKSSPAPIITTPAPSPISLTPSISISSDGCYVTADGTQGDVLSVWTYQGQHGGLPSYVLPASGTITVGTGGYQGYTNDVTLADSSGNTLLHQTGQITATSCAPAGQ